MLACVCLPCPVAGLWSPRRCAACLCAWSRWRNCEYGPNLYHSFDQRSLWSIIAKLSSSFLSSIVAFLSHFMSSNILSFLLYLSLAIRSFSFLLNSSIPSRDRSLHLFWGFCYSELSSFVELVSRFHSAFSVADYADFSSVVEPLSVST